MKVDTSTMKVSVIVATLLSMLACTAVLIVAIAMPDSASADNAALAGGELAVQDSGASEADANAMFRLYNPYSGEHFYTADERERDNVAAAGWDFEGVGWAARSLRA